MTDIVDIGTIAAHNNQIATLPADRFDDRPHQCRAAYTYVDDHALPHYFMQFGTDVFQLRRLLTRLLLNFVLARDQHVRRRQHALVYGYMIRMQQNDMRYVSLVAQLRCKFGGVLRSFRKIDRYNISLLYYNCFKLYF